ncbi:MAG: hypothetical protein UU53_C0023G0017, partial [Candidatus Curtissbacteria bacterium GW2011_GWC2_41_21]
MNVYADFEIETVFTPAKWGDFGQLASAIVTILISFAGAI